MLSCHLKSVFGKAWYVALEAFKRSLDPMIDNIRHLVSQEDAFRWDSVDVSASRYFFLLLLFANTQFVLDRTRFFSYDLPEAACISWGDYIKASND